MTNSTTIAEALAESIRQTAASYHPGVEEAPVCVLWTDPEKAWQTMVPVMRGLMPELLLLGDYQAEEHQGPVIWLKCALAGKIEALKLPADKTPVLYLPGVARHQLRNADQCPTELQPLVELLYRGIAWTHKNGRDWSAEGFFIAEDGLGLDVAQDESTRLSLRSALPVLAQTPVSQLIGRRLEAMDFDAVVVGDTPRDLLTWIGRGNELKQEWGNERWHAFRSRCRDDFGFDPDDKAPLYAAEKLGQKDGKPWQKLWDRFCEAPARYGGVRDRLSQAQPIEVLALEPETWPGENQKQEAALRKSLESLADKAAHEARQVISDQEKQHGMRREWVWARMGESPLATALEALSRLAECTRSIPTFGEIQEFANWYAETGWEVDAAVLEALRHVEGSENEPAVHQAIRSIYEPWLQEVCSKFQSLADAGQQFIAEPPMPKAEECVLFVDGLRLDLARALTELLVAGGSDVAFSTRLAALPTVTSTAKPAVSPIAGLLSGVTVPADFRPNNPDSKPVTHQRFQKLMTSEGYQVLDSKGDLVPSGRNPKGWCEIGSIDSRGHDLGVELARYVPDELSRVAKFVNALLFAGWRSIRIVTDHGWLLMPGGLKKHDLPGFLVESRWTRCAAIKGESKPDAPTVAWRWNQAEHVVVAPGACAFKANVSYSHGGVSPQECVLPELRVTREDLSGDGQPPRIVGVRWKRQRCNIEVENVIKGLRADIRTDWSDASSSASSKPKEVEADGQVSLLVADETLEGKPVTVVLLTENDELVAKLGTKVGG